MSVLGVTVYGASDDLIEIEGDVTEEFAYRPDGDGHLLAFSDGTVLFIEYDEDGVWRIKKILEGTNVVEVHQAPVDDEGNYSDRARIHGAARIRWVVLGSCYATARGAR